MSQIIHPSLLPLLVIRAETRLEQLQLDSKVNTDGTFYIPGVLYQDYFKENTSVDDHFDEYSLGVISNLCLNEYFLHIFMHNLFNYLILKNTQISQVLIEQLQQTNFKKQKDIIETFKNRKSWSVVDIHEFILLGLLVIRKDEIYTNPLYYGVQEQLLFTNASLQIKDEFDMPAEAVY